MDRPGSEMDRIPYSSGVAGWIVLFSAMVCSIGRDELLHFLSGRARPLAGRDRYPDRYVRIFALRHREISINAPRDHAHQRRQGDLAVFHEKSRGVVRLLNSFLICLMCHGLYPV